MNISKNMFNILIIYLIWKRIKQFKEENTTIFYDILVIFGIVWKIVKKKKRNNFGMNA